MFKAEVKVTEEDGTETYFSVTGKTREAVYDAIMDHYKIAVGKWIAIKKFKEKIFGFFK